MKGPIAELMGACKKKSAIDLKGARACHFNCVIVGGQVEFDITFLRHVHVGRPSQALGSGGT